jgi:hypothetical protein
MPFEDLPRDLPSFQARFGDDAQCRDYLFAARWPAGFVVGAAAMVAAMPTSVG